MLKFGGLRRLLEVRSKESVGIYYIPFVLGISFLGTSGCLVLRLPRLSFLPFFWPFVETGLHLEFLFRHIRIEIQEDTVLI